MKVQEVLDQDTWNGYVLRYPGNVFQQSWEWGEFQKSLGRPVHRFLTKNASDEVTSICQVIGHRRRYMGYWFAPRGPLFLKPGENIQQDLQEWITWLKQNVSSGRTLFYRFEPCGAIEGITDFTNPFHRTRAMSVASTLIIDLKKSEEVLLEEMHQKTRYNIRVAEKHGVSVRVGTEEDLEIFLRLMQETAERDEFISHAPEYLRKTWKYLAPLGFCRLRMAQQDGKPLAGSMEIVFGDTVTYLHGVSSSASRSLMAPYALHWDAIKAAQTEGHHFYDFWGVNPASQKSLQYKASWEGISRFKLGWGGERVEYGGTWDAPIHPILYKLIFLKRT